MFPGHHGDHATRAARQISDLRADLPDLRRRRAHHVFGMMVTLAMSAALRVFPATRACRPHANHVLPMASAWSARAVARGRKAARAVLIRALDLTRWACARVVRALDLTRWACAHVVRVRQAASRAAEKRLAGVACIGAIAMAR